MIDDSKNRDAPRITKARPGIRRRDVASGVRSEILRHTRRQLPEYVRRPDFISVAWRCAFLAFLGVVLWFYLVNHVIADPLIVLSYIPGSLVMIYGLSFSWARDGVGLRLMFWFFNYLFLGIVPMCFAATRGWLLTDRGLPDADIYYSNAIIFLYLIAFIFGERWASRKASSNDVVATTGPGVVRIPIGTVVQFLALGVIVVVAGVGFLLFRSGGRAGSISTTLVISNFVRPLILFLGVLAVYAKIKRWYPGGWALPCISATIAIGANLPFSMARYYMFAIVLTCFWVLVAVRPKLLKIGLPLLLVGLVLSPIASNFRHVRSVDDLLKVRLSNLSYYFYSGHFDAYEILANGVGYTFERKPPIGSQALGAALFWVPRAVWAGKPLGTGRMLSNSYIGTFKRWGNTNLSAPLVLEMLISFRLIGVAVASFILGYVCTKGDVFFRRRLAAAVGFKSVDLCYYGALQALFFFALRGDLLNAVAFTSGFTVAYICARRILFGSIKVRPVSPMHNALKAS